MICCFSAWVEIEDEVMNGNEASRSDALRIDILRHGNVDEIKQEAASSGYSGRFPKSESLSEFWKNLCDGVDLVTETSRYPQGHAGLPGRQAQCQHVDKFDAMFFGISSSQADSLDPQIRLLLEVVYEAIADAGYTMQDLAETNTGVYVGGCFSDMHKALLKDVRTINGYENTGCSHSMFANRVSFCFDFKGPSLTIDTACSSSLVALDIAARDVRSGKVDRAVVAGVSIALDPAVTKSFASYGMLSPDGKCHSFDNRANGYVRADGIGAILLEKPEFGKGRGIASLLGTGSNSDGSKAKGITFPASEQQLALCQSVCQEYKIEPGKVMYVEAHGTGTTAGDGQELKTLNAAYGKSSEEGGVLIGSVKSNMGHAEGASGMMSLLKVLGILTEKVIPTNLHFEKTDVHKPIIDGRLNVVDQTQPLPQDGSSKPLVAINNFGFGGTNAHLVCCEGDRHLVDDDTITRFMFARTEEGLKAYFANKNLNKAAWDLHLRNSSANNKFPFRGVVAQSKSSDSNELPPLDLKTARVPPECPPVAFCYTGQGCQWEGMAKDLWLGDDENSRTFRATVREAAEDLPVDVDELFSSGDKWMSKQWSGFGITLVQLGLTAVLTSAGVTPDYIFGHSVGEVACGYADGCTTAKEAARIAFVRCQLSDKITAKGLMLAVGLDYDSSIALLKAYSDTVIACHNSPDGVTLSGDADEIKEIASSLESKGVFAKLVPTDGIAYHSKFFKEHSDKIESILDEVITDPPVRRTSRWLSTSCEDCRNGRKHQCTPYPSAAYHTRNITGQVNFEPIVKSLPEGVVIVEIGPHALLKSIIKRCRAAVNEENPIILAAMRKNTNGVDGVTSVVDALWLEGVNFRFPKADHMVPIRHRINMQWDHDAEWKVPSLEDFGRDGSNTSLKITFDLAGKDAFLMDHIIDGRSLLPATSHIYSAWAAYGTDSIHFVDVKILGAVVLDGVSVTLTVQTDEKQWKIYHEDNLVSQGSIASDYQVSALCDLQETKNAEDVCDWVDKEAVYARLARYGYEYGEQFRAIEKRANDASQVLLGSACHWIVYLDNILQAFLDKPSGLCLPTALKAVSICCKDVENAGKLLIKNEILGSFGNSDVLVKGLKTSIMRKVHKKPSIRGVEFVSYGEHVVTTGDEELKRQLEEHLTSDQSNVSSKESVLESLEKLSVEKGENNDELTAYLPQDVDVSGTVLSCQAFSDGIDIISQVLRQNLPQSYSVLRVGDRSAPSSSDDLFQALSSLIEHEMEEQTFRAISEVSSAESRVDVIVASRALYAAESIAASLSQMYENLNEGGFLVIREYLGALPSKLWGKCVSVPEDEAYRASTRWISKNSWLNCVRSAGFEAVTWYTDESETQLVLLAIKTVEVGPEGLAVISSHTEVTTSPTLLETDDYGYLGFVKSLRKEPGYSDLRLSLDISPQDISAPSFPKYTPLYLNVSRSGVAGGMHEVPLRSKKNLQCHGYHLRSLHPGDLDSFAWVENEVEPNCQVRYCGVNFKDVMLSYGKLVTDDPEGHVKIGLEFSGIANGRPVMGISAGCMASHIKTVDHLLWEVPPSLSLEEACTIPVVYSTVYYALVVKANIRQGQTVLVHSVAGGVGQAAFHVCKSRGVNVIATCSNAKKEWVQENLGLPEHLILDSHSNSFRDEVLTLTNGNGVDAVLNSLAGEKLQASLECVGAYGHFCEIGKYDIQQNMLIGMGIFERNVSIHGFDLSDMFSKPQLWQPVRDLLCAGLESGEVKPLRYTVFDEPVKALRYLSTGKHIGKVIVRLPESDKSDISTLVQKTAISKSHKSFYTHGTHLVVGGLGGFGMEMVLHLKKCGASRIIIASRGKPKPHQLRLLGDIVMTHVNLKDAAACEDFFKTEGSDLVGIWHLGMVLNDCLYDKMTAAQWEETVATKALICKNLDASSRVHCKGLQYFVMWSSVSALFGNPGQTNYAYANSSMEGTCIARREAGLPAVSIQWGFIGSVGVLMKNQATNSSLGFYPQHIDSCLDSLSSILASDHAVVTSYIRRLNRSDADENGAKSLTISQRVARVLGLDPNKINSTDMLASLGMDSLQSVEIANVLKVAGLTKAIDELRFTTWMEILKFD